ncbi:MAG: NAD-dependent dehydratase [Chloroflexi bacterium HGW-Chloroflexi-3]|nr:MAG: NAD-dependent dehydratase [Chloroflexi bacterium HGW-Chloroflexi-3]
MNILLTGAAGFIGSNLSKELRATSYKLRAFVRYNSRADIGLLSTLPPELLSTVEIIFGDLRDPSAILEAATGCDLIYHLGALISIPYSYLHPVETVQSNILGTLNILEAARQLNIPVVHTSTSEVYGTAMRVPIDESHPLQGQSPYSASKIGADKLVESYYRSFEVPTITVRPFNTYGPGQSARAVIPTIITQALTQDHLNLGSLDTRRDFTYIDDTVSGFLLAGKALIQATSNSYQPSAISHQLEPRPPSPVLGHEYNLGTGTEVTIGEITHLILKILNKPNLPIIQDKERLRPEKSEVLRLLSDNTKARQTLGWTPTINLEEGLTRTIAWISDHLDRYRIGIYER